MPRSRSSSKPPRHPRRRTSSTAPSVAAHAARKAVSIPSNAEVVTTGAHADTAGDITPFPGAGSVRDGLDAEWQRLWDAAPESVRWAFAKCLNRLAMPRPILYDNFMPHTERRVETLLTLYARRLQDSAPRDGR